MEVYVLRNGQRYGPYEANSLLGYVNKGLVLKQDRAIEVGKTEEHPVNYFLKKKPSQTKD